jgi:putative transposase
MSTHLEPLSAERRYLTYAACDYPEASVRRLEEMIEESGKRKVGKGALKNVATIFASIKCQASRITESHTVEQLFAYECELDPGVLGYWCQVPCPGVVRTTVSGRRHVSGPTLDFLVFREDRVTLVECKAISWLKEQSKLGDSEWVEDHGRWHNVALQQYCDDLGIELLVYAAPEPPAIYKQNLELCVASLRSSLSEADSRLAGRVIYRLSKGGASLARLFEELPGFDVRVAVAMLARGLVYAPLRSHSIDDVQDFVLYPDKMRADLQDLNDLDVLCGKLAQPNDLSPLTVASRACLARATSRAATVTAIAFGDIKGSAKMRRLTERVTADVDTGKDLVAACLPNYKNCGNRVPRLTSAQRDMLEYLVEGVWNKGLVRTPGEVFLAMGPEATRRGISPIGRTTLYKMIRAAGNWKNALHRRGMRGYQAARDRGDPRYKTQPPLAYGHTIHIDSSRFDAKIAPDIVRRLPSSYGTFYVAVDAQSDECMAYAFIFGPARTDGLALLMRDLVRRHRRLPMVIHMDRGSENLSTWAKTFFAGITSLRISPTAGSKYNGIAENLIKQVNNQVADRIPGNTRNDKEGRGADGRLKSIKQMKLAFLAIIELIESYLFVDRQATRRATGMTRMEHKAEALATYGEVGIPTVYDEDFIYRTSVPITVEKSCIQREGIRLSEGLYSCPELLVKLRTCKVQEVRLDPATAAYVFVRIDGCVLKAFRGDCVPLLASSADQGLFTRLAQSCIAIASRAHNEKIASVRYDRTTLAKMAARHDNDAPLPDSLPSAPAMPPASKVAYEPLDWDALGGFEEDER